jgi:hypothetical protein
LNSAFCLRSQLHIEQLRSYHGEKNGRGEGDHEQQQLCNRNKTKLCVFEDLRNPTLCAKKLFATFCGWERCRNRQMLKLKDRRKRITYTVGANGPSVFRYTWCPHHVDMAVKFIFPFSHSLSLNLPLLKLHIISISLSLSCTHSFTHFLPSHDSGVLFRTLWLTPPPSFGLPKNFKVAFRAFCNQGKQEVLCKCVYVYVCTMYTYMKYTFENSHA